MDHEESDDLFIEYELKPVNRLCRQDGLKIKNRVLRQAKLNFNCSDSSINQNTKKNEIPKEAVKKRRKSKESTPQKKARIQNEKVSHTKIVNFLIDNSPGKQKICEVNKSRGIISVQNDVLANADTLISTNPNRKESHGSQQGMQSPYKNLNDHVLAKLSSSTAQKPPENSMLTILESPIQDKPGDVEVISLSPGIKRHIKRFKSLAKSPLKSDVKNEKVKRNLFDKPISSEPFVGLVAQNSNIMPREEINMLSDEEPKSSVSSCMESEIYKSVATQNDTVSNETPIENRQNVDILAAIIEDVIKSQVNLKESMLQLSSQRLESLISDSEMSVLEKYLCLDRNSQSLFMRMYFRKTGWHRASHLKYTDLSSGLSIELGILASANLVRTNVKNEDARVQLALLKTTELMKLSKIFTPGGRVMKKEEMMDALLTETKQQKSVMDLFGRQQNGTDRSSRLGLVLAEAQKFLGLCFQLTSECRQALDRVVLLFSLTHDVDDEAKRATSQRFMMQQVLGGLITFVPYEVVPVVVFEKRDDFLEYELSLRMRQEMEDAFQAKNHDDFTVLASRAKEAFRRLVSDVRYCERISKLPSFLRRYSAGSVYAGILTRFCEHFKKKTDTQEVIKVLSDLLQQSTFRVGMRGKWYDMMCQAYQSLKIYEEGARVILMAARDQYVDEVQSLGLQIRAQALLKAKKNRCHDQSLRDELTSYAANVFEEPSSIEINAQAVAGNVQGSKLVYVQNTPTGKRYSSVEEQAIYHYKTHGYTEGIHAEGFVVSTIFYLFFFDLIYFIPVHGVFLSRFQERPLDFWSSSFFTNRRDYITTRLEEMVHWTPQDVAYRIEDVFARYKGACCLVSWRDYFSPKLLCEIIECIGMRALTTICERFVQKPRLARSGFPDLTLWNINTKTCKFVEVKSPNDKLAPNQRVWLQFLKSSGIECEVCNVRNTGSKLNTRML